MKKTHRIIAVVVTAVLGVGFALAPLSARASEEGRRNTALALGATAAALLLTQKNKAPGALAAVGAVVAYNRYTDSVSARHHDRDYGYYERNHYRDRDWDRSRDRYDRDRNRDHDRDRHDHDSDFRRDHDRYHR